MAKTSVAEAKVTREMMERPVGPELGEESSNPGVVGTLPPRTDDDPLEDETEDDNPNAGAGTDDEEAPSIILEEKLVIKAVGVNSTGKSNAKKALDARGNQLEADEGWEYDAIGHAEKFTKDGDIVHTFTATLKRPVKMSLLTLKPVPYTASDED